MCSTGASAGRRRDTKEWISRVHRRSRSSVHLSYYFSHCSHLPRVNCGCGCSHAALRMCFRKNSLWLQWCFRLARFQNEALRKQCPLRVRPEESNSKKNARGCRAATVQHAYILCCMCLHTRSTIRARRDLQAFNFGCLIAARAGTPMQCPIAPAHEMKPRIPTHEVTYYGLHSLGARITWRTPFILEIKVLYF